MSAAGVIMTLLHSARVAKRRATLDMLLSEQSTEFMRDKRRKFLELKKVGNLPQWASKDKTATEEAITIGVVLNRYELVAISIKEKTIDEEIYKKYIRTGLVNDWIACKPYVMEMRLVRNNPKIYCEFHRLASSWAEGDERRHV